MSIFTVLGGTLLILEAGNSLETDSLTSTCIMMFLGLFVILGGVQLWP